MSDSFKEWCIEQSTKNHHVSDRIDDRFKALKADVQRSLEAHRSVEKALQNRAGLVQQLLFKIGEEDNRFEPIRHGFNTDLLFRCGGQTITVVVTSLEQGRLKITGYNSDSKNVDSLAEATEQIKDILISFLTCLRAERERKFCE